MSFFFFFYLKPNRNFIDKSEIQTNKNYSVSIFSLPIQIFFNSSTMMLVLFQFKFAFKFFFFTNRTELCFNIVTIDLTLLWCLCMLIGLIRQQLRFQSTTTKMQTRTRSASKSNSNGSTKRAASDSNKGTKNIIPINWIDWMLLFSHFLKLFFLNHFFDWDVYVFVRNNWSQAENCLFLFHFRFCIVLIGFRLISSPSFSTKKKQKLFNYFLIPFSLPFQTKKLNNKHHPKKQRNMTKNKRNSWQRNFASLLTRRMKLLEKTPRKIVWKKKRR